MDTVKKCSGTKSIYGKKGATSRGGGGRVFSKDKHKY